MKKNDTRVQYTKDRLKTAILVLMQEKSVDRITVKELCDLAGLNRGTFYLHYDSPVALLKDIERQFLEDHIKLFHSFLQEARNQNIMTSCFSCIRENRSFFLTLMGPHGDPGFVSEVFDGMRQTVLDQWQFEFPHYDRDDLDFIFDYVLSGSTRLIVNWLQDSKGITATQFARRMERLGHYALVAIREFREQ